MQHVGPAALYRVGVVQRLVSYFLFIHLSRLLRIDVAIAKAAVETGAVLRQLHGAAGSSCFGGRRGSFLAVKRPAGRQASSV